MISHSINGVHAWHRKRDSARTRSCRAICRGAIFWIVLVGVAGFEPATPSSRTRCATRLRYTPPDQEAGIYTQPPGSFKQSLQPCQRAKSVGREQFAQHVLSALDYEADVPGIRDNVQLVIR
jgi:hypothetical protein